MFEAQAVAASGKDAFHAERFAAQLSGERDPVANASAQLFGLMPDLNWAGLYLMRDGGLALGPFQGKFVRARIPVGHGVRGTKVARALPVLADDVDAFPGHIARGTGSRSKLVVPLIQGGAAPGVIDLDSPRAARFDARDQAGIERVATIYVNAS